MELHRLNFKAPNGYPSSCDITLYPEIQLVVVSETGEGMSVTNAAETIATEVVKRFGLDPKRLMFVEHYSEEQRPQPYGESYDLVTFTWGKYGAHTPVWRSMPPNEFKEILSSINQL
ncbi:hypothetical protein GCM10027592_63220 [Spirosoma flavus]